MDSTCDLLLTCSSAPLRLIRKFELGGDVLVQPGEMVDGGSLIGQNRAEELLHYLRVETDESRTLAKLLKQVGDDVKRGEPVAYYMFMFGLGYREYVSPVNGTLVSFDQRNGLIAIREHRTPLFAGLSGTVETVISGYGAVLGARGALIEATAGWGGVAWGELMMLADGPDQEVDPALIGAPVRGKLVYVGSCANERVLQACYRHGAKAVIAGGADQLAADEFTAFAAAMTYEEYATRYYAGSGVTDELPDGADSVPMPVVALEALGRAAVRQPAYAILAAADGKMVFVDAAGDCLLCGSSPSIIVPDQVDAITAMPAEPAAGSRRQSAEVGVGAQVRIVGGPHNGNVARISSLLPEMVLATGLRAPGAVVRLTGVDEPEIEVPLVNLEVIADGR